MDKKDIRDLKWFFFFLTAFFIFLPKLINLWMIKWHITTGPGLGNAEWLGFWGSYIGSILGVMATLLAFLITYIQNRNQHHQTQKMLGEQLRLSVLPVFQSKFWPQFPVQSDKRYFCFTIDNARTNCVNCLGEIDIRTKISKPQRYTFLLSLFSKIKQYRRPLGLTVQTTSLPDHPPEAAAQVR